MPNASFLGSWFQLQDSFFSKIISLDRKGKKIKWLAVNETAHHLVRKTARNFW